MRNKATDVVDVWRCLEVALVAGVGPHDFADGDRAEAAALIRALFSNRGAPGMGALESEQRLSSAAIDERFTRLRALIDRIIGSS